MASSTLNYNSSDPRSLAAQQRAQIGNTGAVLNDQYAQYGQQNSGGAPTNTVSGTSDYLNSIESPLAQGQGGYTADEASQIELTPAQQQSMVNSAGISAGVANQAAVGGAERAANAAGGNPAALAAYRARAAQQSGVNAGNAMTNARVAAQQAGSAGAQAVGNAQIAQQNQGLNYYQGQNAQANANVNNANQLQEQTYGTQTSGGNQAAGLGVQASQTPSTFDKTIGAIGGALGGLADGTVPSGSDAVIGEDGPEKVVDMSGHDYMADGGLAGAPEEGVPMDDDQASGAPMPPTPTAPTTATSQPWYKKLLTNHQSSGGGQSQPQKQWSPVNTYSSLGQAAGKIAGTFLADGGFPQGKNGIFTKPTNVKLGPNDAVVPLNYRPGAKIRPSMAALPAARTRQPYGSAARG